MPKKIDAALRSQAVRLVTEHRSEYSSERALHIQVADSLGVSRESVRRWVMQYEVDAGQAAGVTSDDREELRRLRAENKRLREVNEVLKSSARGAGAGCGAGWGLGTGARLLCYGAGTQLAGRHGAGDHGSPGAVPCVVVAMTVGCRHLRCAARRVRSCN
ncbi:transposase [Streptomyces sp. NPDC127051]|uniref:transposase n=1 Tax=Streptomyces sp. NPDC127051 TaxID=3347119 RepID=UPI00365C362D